MKNRARIAGAIIIVILAALAAGLYVSRGGKSPAETTSASSLSVSVSSRIDYAPACIPLNQAGGVHVTGSISASSAVNVNSATLWWRYQNSGNNWYQLNDLVLGQTFSIYGNFSHRWDPPSVNHYDFEANWTLSSGQLITAITSNPLQVVAQGASCP
jgi:hypothetical protein